MDTRFSVRGLWLLGLTLPIVVVALVLVTASAAAAESRAKPHRLAACALPAHARLVAQDAQTRIIFAPAGYTDANGDYVGGFYKSCLRRRGGWSAFAEMYSGNDGLGDIVNERPLKLAGVYFAYTISTLLYGGRYDAVPDTAVQIVDAGTGHVGTAGSGGPTAFVLSSSGIAAWQGQTICGPESSSGSYGVCAWSVWALDGNTGWRAVLDTTPPPTQNISIPDPFGGPQIYTCDAGCGSPGSTMVWWQRDGVWYSTAAK